jgi:hypothetical protein
MAYGRFWNSKTKGKIMNESKNPETPKKRGWSSWSIIRKIQVTTILVGALLTIGIISFCAFIQTELTAGLAMLVQLPTVGFLKMIYPKLINELWGQPSHTWFLFVVWLCAVTFINSFLLFVVATIGGWFIKRTKNKTMNL